MPKPKRSLPPDERGFCASVREHGPRPRLVELPAAAVLGEEVEQILGVVRRFSSSYGTLQARKPKHGVAQFAGYPCSDCPSATL
jgi:hypothetical protein